MVAVMVVIGIPLGVNAAIHRGGVVDRCLMSFSMLFISIPEFWLALMLILLFSLKLSLLPPFGVESWTCYIMPVISGSLAGVCNVARQTRASVLEVVNADYITTARSKGMKERLVIYKHMLPNALIPVITLVGNYLTRCVGGTIVIEKIFSFPGIGLYLTDAISSRDLPIIRGCVILLAAFTAVLMFLVDLAYGFVDPRIKAQYADSGKKKGRVEGNHGHHGHGHDHGHGHRSVDRHHGEGRRLTRSDAEQEKGDEP
jgi:peptide/nickel transport system permease protein